MSEGRVGVVIAGRVREQLGSAAVVGMVGLALLIGQTVSAPAEEALPVRHNPFREDRENVPDVVARVNGRAISGAALERRMLIARRPLDLGRDNTDPRGAALDQLIEEEVLLQLAQDRGVIVSPDEARSFARAHYHRVAAGDPAAREILDSILTELALPAGAAADDPRVIERFGRLLTLRQMRAELARTLRVEHRGEPGRLRAAITDYAMRGDMQIVILLDR